MKSSILYTDVGRVARSLAMQAPEYITSPVSSGGTIILLNQVPSDWQVGMSLLIDGNNPSIDESVTITSINSNTINVSALKYNHVANAPVINITQLNDFISPASRWFDGVTNTSAGFGYESITETKEATINRDGYIVVPLSKPIVNMSNVTSATFQATPIDNVDTLNLQQGWITDGYFLRVVPTNYYSVKRGQITVTYSGGFTTIPDDIIQAVTVMAARFYKEKDSGYSDVIGSSDMGIMSYKKAMPADVKETVKNYKRWVI